MTAEEALGLGPGDRVRVFRGQDVFPARVIEAVGDPARREAWYVHVRREGLTRAGRRHGSFYACARQVEPLQKHDEATANVFADWLDDRGQHEAAAMLRKAFPLSGPAAVEARHA
jgi:uncharacterized protein (TIGR02996 family)